MSPKRWIFTKSTENRPDGVLQVGQILSDPFEPGTALHPGGPLPLVSVPEPKTSRSTEESLPPPTMPKTYLYYGMLAPEETSLSGVQLSQASELTSQFGLWAKLSAPASAAGPGAAVSGSVSTQSSRSETGVWEIAKIRSVIITPSIMYVQDSLRHGDVPSSVSLRWWNRLKGKRLFMVTGVRIVEGARLVKGEKKEQRGWGVQGEGQVQVAPAGDGSAGPGVQAGIGGNLSSDQSATEEISFESATDFVFAYRLQEIFWYGTGGKVKHSPYKKGETASVRTGETIPIEEGGSKNNADEEEEEFEDFEITDVDEEDFGEAAALQPWPGVVEQLVPGVDEVLCLAV